MNAQTVKQIRTLDRMMIAIIVVITVGLSLALITIPVIRALHHADVRGAQSTCRAHGGEVVLDADDTWHCVVATPERAP